MSDPLMITFVLLESMGSRGCVLKVAAALVALVVVALAAAALALAAAALLAAAAAQLFRRRERI